MPRPGPRAPIANALTVDVEDYFHVSAFDTPSKRLAWDGFERRVSANTDRLLALFDEAGVRATFFVLGWVAERDPSLVRRIAACGHEVASHGYAHQLVYTLTPEAFLDDVRRARDTIEAAALVEVTGYRAPSFSVTGRSLWALDVLVRTGHRYDSSVFPVSRGRYGIPDAPRAIHAIERPSGRLIEVPPSTVRIGRMNVPVAGGGYFRLYPYTLTRAAIRWINGAERQPAVVYIHPWEIDVDQPRQAGSAANRFRHYVNLDRTEARLSALLREFAFVPMRTLVDEFVRADQGSRHAHRVPGSPRAGARSAVGELAS